MKKTLVVVLAAALTYGSAAFAGTQAIGSDILSMITGGSGSLGSLVTGVNPLSTDSITSPLSLTDPGTVALGAGNSAADNGAYSFDGAIADHDALALNGAGNVGVDVAVDLGLTDSLNTNTAVGDGSAAVMGDNNHTYVDNTYVDGQLAGNAYGVIAREATVTNSFNTKISNVYINVEIDDSFNVTNNSLDISGQNNLTAIINANSTGEQLVGACLNVTNAAASMPEVSGGTAAAPIISGNALAITILRQTVINSSIVLDGTAQMPGLGAIALPTTF